MTVELNSDERLWLVEGLYLALAMRREEELSDHSKGSNEIFELIGKLCPVSPTS